MRLGAHVSAAGGVVRAVSNGVSLGCETIQFFGASPQAWSAKGPSDREAQEFAVAREKSPIQTAYLHASYLANLASPDPIIFARSVKSLSDHLSIAERLRADGLIFHIGSGREILEAQAIQNVARGMAKVLENVPGKSFLIMENSAGGGAKIGFAVRHLGAIFRLVASPRAKLCFDTAHAFEAGEVERYEPDAVEALCDECDRGFGLENLLVVHVNDSKTAFNSHHDRHENLGEGFLGLDAFRNLFREKRLAAKDWILEVPGFEDLGPDKKNMELLRSCSGR